MQKKILALIFLAVFLRFIDFGQIPYGVNRDEASMGYNALSIIRTGMDEHQKSYPIQFESFGDWKKPVYIYLSTIPIKIFGLSPVTIRLTSLIFSIILILSLYHLTNKYFKNSKGLKYSSIFLVLLLTLNPWHFHFSRIALEAMVAISFFSVGVLLQSHKKHILASILFILSIYTYHSAIIIIPLWQIGFSLLKYKNSKEKQKLMISNILIGIILFLQFNQTFFSPEKAKVSGLVIFDLPLSVQQQIMDSRVNSFSKLIHNRYIYIGSSFIKNYFQAFSPTFLYKKGGGNPSYNIPGFGNFYFIEIILFILGLSILLKSQTKNKYLVLLWLIISPIPAALTYEATHSVRNIFMIPPILMIASMSLSTIWSKRTKLHRQISYLTILFILVSAYSFFKYYFADYKNYSDRVFHGYMKEVSLDIKQNLESEMYENLFVEYYPESPYIYYAFYNQIDPKYFHQNIIYRNPDHEGFVHAKSLDRIIFDQRDEYDVFYKIVKPQNNLVYSKSTDVVEWIKPIDVWDNLEGEPIITSWNEEQIK